MSYTRKANIILALILMSASIFSTHTTFAAKTPTGIIVPAYFDPSVHAADWQAMNEMATAGTPVIAIANPNSGPGTKALKSYSGAISNLHNAGGKVIGYVSTSYGSRSASKVIADINKWNSYYKIDGIFLDEMSTATTATKINYYKNLYTTIKKLHPEWIVVGNPGTVTNAKYFPLADILVTFESSESDYINSDNLATLASSKQAALVYGVTDLENVQNIAATKNASWIYFTVRNLSEDPWARIDTSFTDICDWLRAQ